MLRATVFENFVCFRHRQIVKFRNGPNFLVGANATGKSSIFELIRRCLPNKVSSSISTVTNEKFPAFVLCKFDITESLSDELPTGECLYSYIYVKHLSEDKKEMYRLVYISNTKRCYLNWCTIPKGHSLEPEDVKHFDLSLDTDEIPKGLEELFEKKTLDSFHNEMIRIKDTKSERSENKNSKCDQLLQKIHDSVAITFPIRSPGPIQWSHTQNIGIGNEHYDTASSKAEILQQLLESDDVDQVKSKEIFDTLIHPFEYTFKRDPTKPENIILEDGKGNRTRLLKVPEGIMEAKQFSLLFAHKKFQTIMLEEPDRGMHPSMVQKLRDLVMRKKECQKKVLVCVSHQTAMINRWGMSRMYVCRRKRDAQRNWKHSVFELTEKVENIHKEEDKLKEMLYATGVLFVQGITNKPVIGSVFDQILEAEHLENIDDQNLKGLQKRIAGVQVICIDGANSYNTLKKMANSLGITFAFLFDKDVLFKCMANVSPKKKEKKEEEKERKKYWRKSTLNFVKILLQRRKYYEEKRKFKEEEIKKQTELIQDVLDTPTTNKTTVKQALKLGDRDLENPTLQTITSFIKDVVLPSELKDELVKEKAKDFDLRECKATSTKGILDYMKKKNVYLWGSGNIEDVICTSILEITKDEEKQENLLRSIFLGAINTDEGKDPKDFVKETLKQMDSETSESIATCLLKSKEMKCFLEFLLKIETE